MDYLVSYTPSPRFAPGELVSVRVAGSDLADPPNAMEEMTWNFYCMGGAGAGFTTDKTSLIVGNSPKAGEPVIILTRWSGGKFDGTLSIFDSAGTLMSVFGDPVPGGGDVFIFSVPTDGLATGVYLAVIHVNLKSNERIEAIPFMVHRE